jgi:hypothetical protein
MNNYHDTAHTIVLEYLKAYYPEYEDEKIPFIDIDKLLEQSIENALNRIDSTSWEKGYKSAREDFCVDG